MSVSSPPPPDGPPTWLLEMMNNTKEMMNNTKTSLNEIKNAVEQNTSSIASFQQLVKPLADEVARVDMARLEDKVELSEKIENVTSKVATEINEMRTENLTRTKEILDKMKSLEQSLSKVEAELFDSTKKYARKERELKAIVKNLRVHLPSSLQLFFLQRSPRRTMTRAKTKLLLCPKSLAAK